VTIIEEELKKLENLTNHLNKKLNKYGIENSELVNAVYDYTFKVRVNLPRIREEIENGNTNR
jgi:hypothetical protein